MISASSRKKTVNDSRIDMHSEIFSPLSDGRVEDEHREESDGHARNDQVDGVEQSLATHRDVERDVGIRLRAARVELLVLLGGNAQQVPFDRRVEVLELDAVQNRVEVADAGRSCGGCVSDRPVMINECT
jgi:hypothetical protein